MMKIVMIS